MFRNNGVVHIAGCLSVWLSDVYSVGAVGGYLCLKTLDKSAIIIVLFELLLTSVNYIYSVLCI